MKKQTLVLAKQMCYYLLTSFIVINGVTVINGDKYSTNVGHYVTESKV